MREQDVIKRLTEVKDLVGMSEVNREAIDEAIHLILMPKHVWHSTANGLRPEKKKFVKVTTVHDRTNKKDTSLACYDPETDSWLGLNNHYKVIAWMDEPEPFDGD